MKMPSNKALAINGAIILIVGAAALVQARDLIMGKVEPICSSRYSKLAVMPLDRGGQKISPADIQSASFGQDQGVMNNLSIRRLKEGPATFALGVKLEAGAAQPTNPNGPQGGVSFPWRPRGIPSDAASACLTYHVFLPADFEYESGGSLPGLFASSSADQINAPDRVDVRFVWGARGSVHQSIVSAGGENPTAFATVVDQHFAGMPRGRWVRIDQEVMLNTPKISNGVTRLWIDEVLRAEVRNSQLRDEPVVTLQGVTADVHFGLPSLGARYPESRAKKTEQVWITPFELRWN